jgi:hypothetical protein
MGLDEKGYAQAFKNLNLCSTRMVTLKEFNTRMRDVGGPLAAICEHIIYWVDPTFVKPASSEPDKLHGLDWMKLMAHKLWGPTGDMDLELVEIKDIRSQRKDMVFDLVMEISAHIEGEMELWKKEVPIDGNPYLLCIR